MSVFRNDKTYNELLQKFDIAVIKVWPEFATGEAEISKLSQDPKDMENLVLASYRLMKYIRLWLKKKKLPCDEGYKYPNLYNALEDAVRVTTAGTATLAIEAAKLEAVSRAAYSWMKTYKMVKTTALTIMKKCYYCKENYASDRDGYICDECTGTVPHDQASGPIGSDGRFDDDGYPLPGHHNWRETGDMAFTTNRFR